MNLTLFLGAGFSAAFGHPVMDNFLGFADSCPRLTDDDRAFLGRLVLEARRANSFLESSPTNLEDILSFSEMSERLGLTKESENRSRRLREIIQKIYTTSAPAREYWERYQFLERLIGVKPRDFKGTLSFVTTNYDLNIESACLHLGSLVSLGFDIHRTGQGNVHVLGGYYDTKGIPLYKLHGSVNWYPADDEPGLAVDDRVVQVIDPGIVTDYPLRMPAPCAGDYKAPDVPVIIPPSFLKPDLPNALKAIWSGAAKVLSTANVVAFVGYSFPPSDTEMMFFLASAFSENSGLRAVYLVDKKANAIVSRLRASGSKIGSHFRDLLNPIESNWTQANLQLGLA